MEKILMILEVSRKQDYIVSSQKLRENALRSADINYVTGSAFFRSAAGDCYREAEHLVYAGGGHTVLQFDDRETATRFASKVTEAALRQFDGMELFVTQLPYDETKTPGENLTELSRALERKKALRRASFRQMGFGVETLDAEMFRPVPLEDWKRTYAQEPLPAPAGWEYPADFGRLARSYQKTDGEKRAIRDNFIAVVHIDGNAMGKRVEEIYRSHTADWDACRISLRRFSESIQRDFESAFLEMVKTVAGQGLEGHVLPIRPIILAGDDVCFVTAGSIGLECARVFLERLSAMENCEQPGVPYAACAGVAIVHTKYPFHRAYQLSEELCSSAKRFGAALREDGSISAMDWHIEFGQMKDSLSELREDYETEDGNRLELRPVTVVVPAGADVVSGTAGMRTYEFFNSLCRAVQGEYGNIARSKIKALREAFKQGELESEFFLRDKQVRDLLYHGFTARHRTEEQRRQAYRRMLDAGIFDEQRAFTEIDGTKRCLFFDAIELVDHYKSLEEVDVCADV